MVVLGKSDQTTESDQILRRSPEITICSAHGNGDVNPEIPVVGEQLGDRGVEDQTV